MAHKITKPKADARLCQAVCPAEKINRSMAPGGDRGAEGKPQGPGAGVGSHSATY